MNREFKFNVFSGGEVRFDFGDARHFLVVPLEHHVVLPQAGLVENGQLGALPLAANDADLASFQGLAPTVTVTMRSGCSLRAKAARMSCTVTRCTA